MELVDVCFEIVEGIRHPYRFIFSDQLMRASVSIPSNIAEGHRRSTKGYMNHLSYSLGSLAEVETILELLQRRQLTNPCVAERATSLCESVGRMLHALVASLECR
jgi:four helix bundle protein